MCFSAFFPFLVRHSCFSELVAGATASPRCGTTHFYHGGALFIEFLVIHNFIRGVRLLFWTSKFKFLDVFFHFVIQTFAQFKVKVVEFTVRVCELIRCVARLLDNFRFSLVNLLDFSTNDSVKS